MPLPSDLCFVDRSKGQLDIMPVMLSRAESWVMSPEIGIPFEKVFSFKERRPALMTSKKRTLEQFAEYPRPRKRARKTKTLPPRSIEIQEKIYWAPVEPQDAETVEAFIEVRNNEYTPQGMPQVIPEEMDHAPASKLLCFLQFQMQQTLADPELTSPRPWPQKSRREHVKTNAFSTHIGPGDSHWIQF